MMEVKRVRKLTKQRFLNLFEATWQKDKATKGKWLYASRREKPQFNDFKTPDAVSIVPVIIDARGEEPNKLLMIDEYRIPLRDRQLAFPPACWTRAKASTPAPSGN